MRALRWLTPLFALVLAACGGSSESSTASRQSTAAGQRRFTASEMAIHFDYPASFRAVSLASLTRSAGGNGRATHAALGIGPYDLLIVSRDPGLAMPVTSRNIAQLKPQFDAAVSQAVGQPLTGTTGTAGGLPAIFWPRVPLRGLPVPASVRIANVFTGADEYELQCQATPQRVAVIDAACQEMLSTMSVS